MFCLITRWDVRVTLSFVIAAVMVLTGAWELWKVSYSHAMGEWSGCAMPDKAFQH